MVIGTLGILRRPLLCEQYSGLGGNQEGQSPVEYRGNLSVRPFVHPGEAWVAL